MAMSVREALARVVDLFGPVASWDPTKLYGNLMVSPNGNVLAGTTTDNGTDKLQVAGTVHTTGIISQQQAAGNLFNSLDAPAANYRGHYIRTSGVIRWYYGGENTAEGGSNAGTHFIFARYNDAGTWIDNLLTLNRTNGIVSFGQPLAAPGANYTAIVTNSATANGGGVYRSTGDIGTAWVNWNVSPQTAALQVDASSDGAGYMGVRWTHWGSRHLAAVSAFAGGTGTSTCNIVFNFNSNVTSHTFYDGGAATFAGALTQNSDYRIKTNIELMEPAEVLRRVLLLQPKEYDRHEHEHHLHGRQSGFIAHELQEHFPLLVKGEKDAVKTEMKLVGDLTPHLPGEEPEDYVPPVEQEVEVPDLQSVNYIGMIPYHTAAIQALNDKIEQRDAVIAGLLERLEKLEAK